MKLINKTVIVTGGARGIGRALCRAFAANGARVVVADLLEAHAKSVAAEIEGLAVGCDVTNESDIQALVRDAENNMGPSICSAQMPEYVLGNQIILLPPATKPGRLAGIFTSWLMFMQQGQSSRR